MQQQQEAMKRFVDRVDYRDYSMIVNLKHSPLKKLKFDVFFLILLPIYSLRICFQYVNGYLIFTSEINPAQHKH